MPADEAEDKKGKVDDKDPKNKAMVDVARPLPLQDISGPFQLRPDGTVSLGIWGSVPLAGLTLEQASEAIRNHLLASPLLTLAWVNWVLAVFNLLPAYPLDGGLAYDAWLGRLLGPSWSVRIIGVLGLACAA